MDIEKAEKIEKVSNVVYALHEIFNYSRNQLLSDLLYDCYVSLKPIADGETELTKKNINYVIDRLKAIRNVVNLSDRNIIPALLGDLILELENTVSEPSR